MEKPFPALEKGLHSASQCYECKGTVKLVVVFLEEPVNALSHRIDRNRRSATPDDGRVIGTSRGCRIPATDAEWCCHRVGSSANRNDARYRRRGQPAIVEDD